MRHHLLLRSLVVAIAAAATVRCAGTVKPTEMPSSISADAWWTQPSDLATADLFNGPWGPGFAPDPAAQYTFVRPKVGGFNPGMVVRDPQGREWHVKQTSTNHGNEGPAEVALSRVLSALGYHQPPVYYLPSFAMRDASGVHMETGGRFRLSTPAMNDRGEWSWQANPFVGHPSYQGLLVIMLMFNSSDLKNSNNTLYDVRDGAGTAQWYVVRDLGDALGRTGRLAPQRNNLEVFSATQFITDVRHGFLKFDYHGLHAELVTNRIRPEDAAWAARLIGGLSDHQWQEAFRAGGYAPDTAARFIDILRTRVKQAQVIGGGGSVATR
jgi:hypothetical protein